MDKIQKAADFLVDLRKSPRTVDAIPTEFRPESIEQAYEIQNALAKGLLSHFGGEQIGYKIACTNKLAQELLNVEAPFFGCLLSSSTYPSPARLKANAITHRLIEAEFAFELDADVPASSIPYTQDSIAAFVRSLLPAIEIVDWRYADWTTVGVESLVADNAIHGAWIRGKRYKNWREFDLSVHDVQLCVNGNVTEKGSGAAVLGHPLNALAWLANELPRHGLSLNAGDLVTTGVATNVYFAETGDKIQADFGALGTVDLELV